VKKALVVAAAICLPLISGCVATTKAAFTLDKTIDLRTDPLEGPVKIGFRLEFFSAK
jgi:hypothetical protein